MMKNLERKVPLNKAAKRFSNVIEAQANYDYKNPVGGVYAFVDEDERQVYFGSTGNLWRRFVAHKTVYKNEPGRYPGLHSLFDLNGIENVPVDIVFEDSGNECTKEQLHLLEVLLMHSFDSSWNVCSTDSRFKHPMQGNEHSEETKEKMSAVKSGENNPCFGKFGKDHPTSKPILSFTKEGKFVKEFAGMHEAKRETGINHGNISKCCRGKLKTAGGFKWVLKNNYTENE